MNVRRLSVTHQPFVDGGSRHALLLVAQEDKITGGKRPFRQICPQSSLHLGRQIHDAFLAVLAKNPYPGRRFLQEQVLELQPSHLSNSETTP